ncbi:MAG TPA: PAS domain S-box protein [Desulfuromonadales bacterium]|nr:PAS domain S-box protein [Desulfuromonadales bacterium]
MSQDYYLRVRHRFILLVSTVLLVMLCLFWWQALRERDLIIAAAGRSAASYAAALMEHADRVFVEVNSSLDELIADIVANGGIAAPRSPRFHRIIRNRISSELQYSSIYVLDRAGNLTAHSHEFPHAVRNLSDRSSFRYHRDTPASGLFISAPHTSNITNSTHFSLSRALRAADGSFDGVISLTVESSYFENFHRSVDVGSSGRITLATVGGDILTLVPTPPEPYVKDIKGSILFSTWLPQSIAGVHHIRSPYTGDERIIAYNKLHRFPVVAIVSYSRADVLAAWRTGLWKQGVIALVLALLALFVSVKFLRQLHEIARVNQRLHAQQSELQFNSQLLEIASDAVLLQDEQGALIYFNQALPDMTGYTQEEICRHGLAGIEPPDYADRLFSATRLLQQSGEAFYESAYQRKSGSYLPIEVHARVLELDGCRRILSTVRDISLHKELEYKLESVAMEWRTTFDAFDDAVWLLDMNRLILRANNASQKIFKCAPYEIVGKHCCQVTYGTIMPRIDCPFERMQRSRSRASVQLEIEGKWFEIAVDPVFDSGGEIVRAVYIVKDIDELKRAEQRERVRSTILERIAIAEPLPALLAGIVGVIEQESPGALCSILLVDEDGARLTNGVAPSLPDAFNQAVDGIQLVDGAGSCDTAAFRRERVVVEDLASHPFWKDFVPAREADLRSCWSEPIFSSAGQLQGIFALYRRTTGVPAENELRLIQQAVTLVAIAVERSRSRTERAELQLQLLHAQKMEAIGHLAGGIAHDFNNLLTPILIYADMLKRVLPEDATFQSRVDGIIKASGKARDLTQQLLSFGRKQVMQMQPVDLNEVITSFHTMISRTLRETITLELALAPHPLLINADRSKLEQVLLNLTINAQDAIAVNGTITIETGHVTIDEESAGQHPGMKPGHSVLLSFRDTGCGMSDETIRHIFEPFFSTKEVGHGTGLGLANVYGIVKQHNGFIMASSCEGHGSTFSLYLPATNEPPQVVRAEVDAAATLHSGSATILIVEDNETVRIMTNELLQGFGFRVYSAEHPERALQMLKNIPEKIDLVITDVVMPGMNGQQLFEQIRHDYPEIDTVLYISGYTNNAFDQNSAAADGKHFLQKPFTVNGLMAKINELLHQMS